MTFGLVVNFISFDFHTPTLFTIIIVLIITICDLLVNNLHPVTYFWKWRYGTNLKCYWKVLRWNNRDKYYSFDSLRLPFIVLVFVLRPFTTLVPKLLDKSLKSSGTGIRYNFWTEFLLFSKYLDFTTPFISESLSFQFSLT